MYRIPFYQKPKFIEEVEKLQSFYAGESFEDSCREWFKQSLSVSDFIFTKSCSQALELTLLKGAVPPGSEVIMPSFAYVSLANAVHNNGLKCVFADIEPDTMNLSPASVAECLSPQTSAIITINYAGAGCRYEDFRALADGRNLLLLEDNAHGIGCSYKGQKLGTFGDLGAFSFDTLKHLGCYEGGGLAVNREDLMERLRCKAMMGTNRDAFFRGDVAHYEWVSEGTNTRLAAPLYAILLAQLEQTDLVIARLRKLWQRYFDYLKIWQDAGRIEMPNYTADHVHNGHTFWIKLEREQVRVDLQAHLALAGIQSAFHYYPLHLSHFGKKAGIFRAADKYTTIDSLRLLRLPLYFDLTDENQDAVIVAIFDFFEKRQHGKQ